jgi:hypothetical protein
MKKFYHYHLHYFTTIALILIASCNDDALKSNLMPKEGINILIGDRYLFESDDISHYDQSSRQFFLNVSAREKLNNAKFTKYWILSNRQVVFDGMYVDGTLTCDNSFQDSLLIHDNSSMASFALKFDRPPCWFIYDSLEAFPRNNKKLIDELEKQGKLMKGISTSIEKVELISESDLRINFVVKNNDDSNYYILNPDKKTNNALYDNAWQIALIFKQPNCTFARPSIIDNNMAYYYGDEWDMENLLLLKAGETHSYIKDYSFGWRIEPGVYPVYYCYPGLGVEFISIEQTMLADGRIWLGKYENRVEINIK